MAKQEQIEEIKQVLIKKAFKEGYEKGCETCVQAWANGYNYGYESGKDDGVREFAEELKGKSEMFLVAKGDGVYGEKTYVSIEKIDELLKELRDENRFSRLR